MKGIGTCAEMPAVIIRSVGKHLYGMERNHVCGEGTYSTTQIELMLTNYYQMVRCFVQLAIRRTTSTLPLYGLCTR